MKHYFFGAFLLLTSNFAFAEVSCETFQAEDDSIQVLREGKVLTRDNWKNLDVISNLSYQECKDGVSQELLKVEGKFFWKLSTNDDSCDGGNTYGVIYTYDLKTPVAHIYDTDVYCEKDWGDEYRAANHKCDVAAEAHAQEKMNAFGLKFEALDSSLEIRTPYVFSFIRVTGKLKNKDNKTATVKVLTKLDECKFGSTNIENIAL